MPELNSGLPSVYIEIANLIQNINIVKVLLHQITVKNTHHDLLEESVSAKEDGISIKNRVAILATWHWKTADRIHATLAGKNRAWIASEDVTRFNLGVIEVSDRLSWKRVCDFYDFARWQLLGAYGELDGDNIGMVISGTGGVTLGDLVSFCSQNYDALGHVLNTKLQSILEGSQS